MTPEEIFEEQRKEMEKEISEKVVVEETTKEVVIDEKEKTTEIEKTEEKIESKFDYKPIAQKWGMNFETEDEFNNFNPKNIIEERDRLKSELESEKEKYNKTLHEYKNPFEEDSVKDLEKLYNLKRSRPDLPNDIALAIAYSDLTQMSAREKLILEYKVNNPDVKNIKHIERDIDESFTTPKLEQIMAKMQEDPEDETLKQEYNEEMEYINTKMMVASKRAETTLNDILSKITPKTTIDKEEFIKSEQEKVQKLGQDWVNLASDKGLELNKIKINAKENTDKDPLFTNEYDLPQEVLEPALKQALDIVVNQRIPITENSKEEFKTLCENIVWCDKNLRAKMIHATIKKALEQKEIELLKENFGITTKKDVSRPEDRGKPLTDHELADENIKNIQRGSGLKTIK